MRHEVARTGVCYGYIINKPAVPPAASIGTGVTGKGRVGWASGHDRFGALILLRVPAGRELVVKIKSGR